MTALPPYCSKKAWPRARYSRLSRLCQKPWWSVAVKMRGPDEPADGEVHGIPRERRERQEREAERRVHGAGCTQGAGGEQQRVARQERRDDEPGLGEDDQEEQPVDPDTVGADELEQMAVAMKDEVDDVGMRPLLCHTTRTRLSGAGRRTIRPRPTRGRPGRRPRPAATRNSGRSYGCSSSAALADRLDPRANGLDRPAGTRCRAAPHLPSGRWTPWTAAR